MTEIVCPRCGKVGKTAKSLPLGKQVKCPACKSSFRIDESPAEEPSLKSWGSEPLPAEEPAIVHDVIGENFPIKVEHQEGISRRASKTKRLGRGRVILSIAAGISAFGAGTLAGRASKVDESKPSTAATTETAEIAFNRAINPISIASIYWSEPEDELQSVCVGASKILTDRKFLIGVGEVAAMLTICGRSEMNWRGNEKCVGSEFVAILYCEMLTQGTKSEDAIRILANFLRVRPNAESKVSASKCDETRRTTYNLLKAGRIITLENTLDQLLSISNMVQGNESFRYHRQTGEH